MTTQQLTSRRAKTYKRKRWINSCCTCKNCVGVSVFGHGRKMRQQGTCRISRFDCGKTVDPLGCCELYERF